MGGFFRAVVIVGLVGLVVGAVLGSSHWSEAWLHLSWLSVMRGGALGWLFGILLSPLVFLLWSRKAQTSRPKRKSLWRLLAGVVLIGLTLAPLIPWLASLAPSNLGRNISITSRRLGDRRPNIVLISIDSLRPDYIGAYGDTKGLTPNIDRFAQEATRYDSAYAASSWTLTALASLFTSLPPSRCGLKIPNSTSEWYVESARIDPNVTTLSEQLRKAGYITVADLTNQFLESWRGWDRGFDYFRNEGWAEDSASTADYLTTNARAWLKLNWRQPFFMWAHYIDPHHPYASPEMPRELRAKYPSHWRAKPSNTHADIKNIPKDKLPLYAEFCRVMYAEEVRYTDRWLGRLLEGLREAGAYDNSLIVITADHGEDIFDHSDLCHGHSMYEEVVRVPMLVKWPRGVNADKYVSQVVPVTDLAPTFLEFAHAGTINGVKGESFSRQNGGPDAKVYSEGLILGTEQTALTTQDYRVIHHQRSEKFEVYDRRKDRQEKHDLAATEIAAQARGELKQLTMTALHSAAQQQAKYKDLPSGSLSEKTRQELRSLGYLGK